ncbi:MAG: COX15/CtaA family protein [Proteobacteria bacterium]|jgi:cytochrome c oxidase assembly protein subunit 15|nr:COX15/CtaA family protein [Paracoccaceae bacterium]MDA0319924.1 COX15/CtaA family protein [Pseudomonadota bacterium]MDA0851797.1 COX15/CtaA family protein [Pseudomonadota bacterium]MDA1294401.1 COX15/CtaA family protein [Pseudomonadota bacterium]
MSSKRSIFEDVGDKSSETEKSAIGSIGAGQNAAARRPIRLWLIALFVLVGFMIAVGGLTRLTDSGLSITEWRPLTGAIPPLSDAAWDTEFEKYQQIPEYQLQNLGMSLSEFKVIYWWEWGHRQLGRAIGLVWALGFLVFLLRKTIPVGWTGRLLFVGALGGLQGAIGWWMVASGLSGEMLDVASYRLATHLGIAFIILGFLSWFIFLLGRSESDLMQQRRAREVKLFSISTGLLHLAFLQILLGALVAGIDAGRNYTDWPLMAGEFFPPEPFSITPLWRNFFEDDGLVQFMHRIAGYILFLFGLVVWRKSKSSGNDQVRFAFNAVMAMMVLQVILGVMTVMYGAPWTLAILHQLGAVFLWVLILRARFLSGYPPQQHVRRV